jgi:hypothetical protein
MSNLTSPRETKLNAGHDYTAIINKEDNSSGATIIRYVTALITAATMSGSGHTLSANQLCISPEISRRARLKNSETRVLEEEDLQDLYNELSNLINASDEYYEDGKISNLAKMVEYIVLSSGDRSIRALQLVIDNANKAKSDAVAETVKWIGYMEDQKTLSSRVWLAADQLNNDSPWIRDAAALVLADLLLPYTKPLLLAALESETKQHIKHTLQYALDNLEL